MKTFPYSKIAESLKIHQAGAMKFSYKQGLIRPIMKQIVNFAFYKFHKIKVVLFLSSLIIASSFNSKKLVVGIFKTSKKISIKQKVIEISSNRTVIQYEVLNLGADSLLSWSGDIVAVTYGYWNNKGDVLIVTQCGYPDSTNENDFKRSYEIERYFKSVCSGCPGFVISSTGKDTNNAPIVDTIKINSPNEILYQKEVYRKY